MGFKQSITGVVFIGGLEAFVAKPYPDIAGIPTVGYGSTHYEDGSPVHLSDPEITIARGQAMLQKDCLKCELALNHLVTVPLGQHQVDALIAFMYNVGITGFATSTILKTINTTGPKTVTEEMFTRWDKVHDPKTGALQDSNGLLNRRRLEYKYYSV